MAGEDAPVLAGGRVPQPHLLVVGAGGEQYVEDLGSANGVRLNNCLVDGRTALKNGDTIRTGDDFHIEFQSLSPVR